MDTLKKYSTFEELKSDIKSDKIDLEKGNNVLLQFEAFLNLVQRKFSSGSAKKRTDSHY